MTLPVHGTTSNDILELNENEEKEAGEVSPEKQPLVIEEKEKEKEESWVKKTSKGGNMSLMTVEKRSAGTFLPTQRALLADIR